MSNKDVADAIREVFVSPNVTDLNFEPANLVDVGSDMAHGLHSIARAIDNHAAAVRELTEAIHAKERRWG